MNKPRWLAVPDASMALGLLRPRSYRRLAVASFLRWLVQIGVMLAVFPLMIGRLGAEDFGLWAALTAPTSMVPLLGFGLSQSIVSLLGRLLGEARSADDAAVAGVRVRALAETAAAGWWLSVAAGGVALALGVATAPAVIALLRVPEALVSEGAFLFRASATCLAAMIVGAGMTAMLEGLGRFDLGSLSGGLVAVANSVFLLVAVLVSPTFRSLGVVSLATAALNLIVPLALLARCRWLWLLGGARPSVGALAGVGRLALGLGGASALGIVADPAIKWSLAALVGGVPVASYELANRVVGIVNGSLSALLGPLSAHAARISTEADVRQMSSAVVGIARRVEALALPSLAALAGMSGPLLAVWLGDQVPRGAPVTLVLLSSAILLSFPARPAWATLVARGHGGSLVLAQLAMLSLVGCALALTGVGVLSAHLAAGVAMLTGSAAGALVAFVRLAHHIGRRPAREMAAAAAPGLALAVLAAPWAALAGLAGAGDLARVLANCAGLAVAVAAGSHALGVLPGGGIRALVRRLWRRGG